MRRHGRSFLTGLFFNTGNYNLPSVNDSLGVSRSFSDSINDEMLREERIEREHRRASEHKPDEPTDQPAEDPHASAGDSADIK
jgi:hypothetical protein